VFRFGDRATWTACVRLAPVVLVVLAVAAPPAAAEPPVLKSVGYSSSGQATAKFTIGDDSEPEGAEVATAPDLDPDGSFVDANVLDRDVVFEDDYWKSERRLAPGTYYVHVSVLTYVFCDDLEDDTCEDGEVTEWSNVLTLVVAPPKPGRYTGKTFFGQRITFKLSKDRTTIQGLVADFDIVCQRGGNVLFRLPFPAIKLDGLKFEHVLKLKFEGGGQMKFTAKGTMGLTGRASGRLDARGSLAGAGGGKCNDFGNPTWSAKKT
jgi:hypothetical protein